MPEPEITILGSGVALGVYIPALLLDHHLGQRGLVTETVLIEDLYTDDGLASLDKLREAFHQSFALARLAQRMTRTIDPELDQDRVEALLQRWHDQDRREFVLWSGYWVPLLERYRARRAPISVNADMCRIDARVSPSFRGFDLGPDDREVWFWNRAELRLEHELEVLPGEPRPLAEREPRLVVHGGGWGLGDYRQVADELEARGLACDRVVYSRAEAESAGGSGRVLMVRPGWRPWLREAGCRPRMPPFGEVTHGVDGADFTSRPECHELHLTIESCRAIISKPGGGTLMDSLSSATPVVFLEPYGEAERANAEVWEHLGFGIQLEAWRATGCDPAVLARLGANLLERPRDTVDYPGAVADGVRRRRSAEVGAR